MADGNERLDGLRMTAGEAFSGLHADERLRLRILRAAKEQKKAPRFRPGMVRLAGAVCAALVLAVCGTAVLRRTPLTDSADSVSSLESIRAGGGAEARKVSPSSGIRASIRTETDSGDTLFETGGREVPVICLNRAAYQMLKEPAELDSALTGEAVGTVTLVTDTPSLETGSGETVSDCTEAGEEILSVASLPVTAAVAARVDGKLRLFQRISYAGLGTENASLSDLLGIRGRVCGLTLSSAGTLSGEAAERAAEILLDRAVCVGEDAEPGADTLTFVLDDGLRLQMTADGDTLIGCGAWQCPEFFECFVSGAE